MNVFDQTAKLNVMIAQSVCDHDFVVIQDDSFDHQYGTQEAYSVWCESCGKYLGNDPNDYFDCEAV